jgi:hypothetical protein
MQNEKASVDELLHYQCLGVADWRCDFTHVAGLPNGSKKNGKEEEPRVLSSVTTTTCQLSMGACVNLLILFQTILNAQTNVQTVVQTDLAAPSSCTPPPKSGACSQTKSPNSVQICKTCISHHNHDSLLSISSLIHLMTSWFQLLTNSKHRQLSWIVFSQSGCSGSSMSKPPREELWLWIWVNRALD